jgi:apolipoprotein N-acyltransferase
VAAPILAAVTAAFFLAFAFPKYDLGWIAWIGLIPLLLAISGVNGKKAFLLSMLCGAIFFAAVFSWAFEIPGYKLLHHAILGIYLGLYFGVFGWAFTLITKRFSIFAALSSAPFLWISLEYLRSNFFFLALPFALLAHSQYKYPWVIQFAAVTGAYGISFLIVLVNSALTLLLLILFSKLKILGFPGLTLPSRKSTTSLILSAVALTGLALFYGNTILSRQAVGNKIKLSVLQGNIDQQKKADPKRHAAYIIQTYTNLTRQAAADQPDLILWPEASTPGFVLKSHRLLKKISTLIAEINTPFLIGSSEYPKFIKDRALRREDVGNTALYFSPEGKYIGQYLKILLLPFGEQIPYEDVISWPAFIVPEDKKTYEIPGQEYTLFSLGDTKFGAVICWEVVFPQLFRTFVKNGANFMINLTNEGWFGESAAPYQFLSMSVFRAVENRISLARAANTGISCFIDPYGRITGRVWNNNKDIYVAGYLTQDISLSQEKTLYTNYGDVFVYLNIVIAVLMTISSFFRNSKK